MAKFYKHNLLDVNADRGTWYEMETDPNGGFYIHTKQDIQPVVDWTRKQRNSGRNDKVGDFNHYATIPAHVELELRQKGINIYDKNNTKRLLREINENYPYLKTTNLHHEIK